METSVSFERTFLSGSLPTQLGLLAKTTSSVILGYSSLTGQLPTQLFNLGAGRMRTDFSIRSVVGITGSLPTEIGKWTLFSEELAISFCSIGHRLPTELFSLSRMTSNLVLGANDFEG